MQQKKRLDYPEVISTEEYLAKRKKIKEKEQSKDRRRKLSGNQMWMLAELYVQNIGQTDSYLGESVCFLSQIFLDIPFLSSEEGLVTRYTRAQPQRRIGNMTVQTIEAFRRFCAWGLSIREKIRVEAYMASRKKAPERARIRLSFMRIPPFTENIVVYDKNIISLKGRKSKENIRICEKQYFENAGKCFIIQRTWCYHIP